MYYVEAAYFTSPITFGT